jgi:hypothetical protein
MSEEDPGQRVTRIKVRARSHLSYEIEAREIDVSELTTAPAATAIVSMKCDAAGRLRPSSMRQRTRQ